MADNATPLYGNQGSGRRITGYRGSQAGKSFASDADAAAKKSDEDAWAEYARSIGQPAAAFSGLGGGAMRAKHKGAFETWKSTRTGTGNLGSLIAGGQ